MSKFEDTVRELESQVQDLENDLAKKAEILDDEGKEKARILVSKTEEAIKSSVEKVRNIIADVKEDEKLDEFLEKVKAKSLEAVEFTKSKVEELTKSSEEKKTLDNLFDDVLGEFDKIKDSDAYKKTTDLLNEISVKINEFLERPEVKSAIDKAKTTTVRVAEKGVEGLKKVLNTETEETTETKEEPKE